MRDSWETGRFWFDYAARKSFDVDAVYWATVHEEPGVGLGDAARSDIKRFVQVKMEQLKEYKEECNALFTC